jgi:exopolysaccharide biosynthesis polyprenyl glycosylphosphotransferase
MLKRFTLKYLLFSLVIDMIAILVAFWSATYLRVLLPYGKSLVRTSLHLEFYLIALCLWAFTAFAVSLYDPRRIYKMVDEYQTLTIALLFFALAIAGVLYFTFRETSRLLVVYALIILGVLTFTWRSGVRLIFRLRNGDHPNPQRVLVVGAGEVGQRVAAMIRTYDWTGLRLVGYLDDDPYKRNNGLPVWGALEDIRTVVVQKQVDDVVLALPPQAHAQVNDIVATLHDLPVNVRVVPDYFSLALYRATVDDFGGIPMINLRDPALNDTQRLVKRLFDVVVGGILTLLLLPLMGLIAVAIKLDSRGPVLFKQQRLGENGRLFEMYKFRSMVSNAEELQVQVNHVDEEGHLIHKKEDDPRVTRVGRLLRRWSLDELPQLFNVLKGELSLVGPRPELPWLVERYEPWQRKRFVVPQGLTGWWQVNGRSDKPMHLHTDEDLYYIQNYSLWLDLYILLKTPWVIVRGEGAY